MENDTLALGYIKDGEIFYHFNLPQFSKFTARTQLGVDLLNFIWLREDIIEPVFDTLYNRYLILTSQTTFSKNVIMDSLIELIERWATRSAYLAAYISKAIVYLLSDSHDRYLVSNAARLLGTDYEGLTKEYNLEEVKSIVLGKLPEIITLQQKAFDKALEIAIGDASPLKNFTSAQRLYILSHSEEYKDGCFDMRFQSSLNTALDLRDMDDAMLKLAIIEHNIEFYEMYELVTVDDMLRFELLQMILHDCKFKRCKYCGKYFVPSGRSDSEYCTRIMPDETKPCSEIGASRIRNAKLQTDPILKAYKKAYSRMDSQKRNGSINQKGFNDWSWQAIEKRDHCLAGEIAFDDFQVWLDKTKKRK
jgi:hypothetical protein